MKFSILLFLSFLTTIIVNIFLSIFIHKTSQLSISSNLFYVHYSLSSQFRTKDISNEFYYEIKTIIRVALHLISLNKLKKVEQLFEHALNLDPYNSNVLTEYGQFIEYYHKDIILAEHLYTRALIHQPTDHRALEFRNRILPLVSDLDKSYLNSIDDLLVKFYQIPDANPYLKRTKRHAYHSQIYHSNALKGNTLTLRETQYIVETGLGVHGKSLLEQQEVLGLNLALQYINTTLVNRRQFISRHDVIEIHRRVLGFVNPIESGRLRKHEFSMNSSFPPSIRDMSNYLDDFILWINTLASKHNLHPIEIAAVAHYKLIDLHPFNDGNGRTARLLMNLILMKLGFPPVIIKKHQRFIYYSYFKQRNHGDIRPFIRFIGKCTENTLRQLIHESPTIENMGENSKISLDVDNDDEFIRERVITVE